MFFSFFFSFFFSLVILMIVMVPESITSMMLHVDATLSFPASYLSIFLYFLDVMSPRLLLLSYGYQENVMTDIHVATNVFISVTVGKPISLGEKNTNVVTSNNDIHLNFHRLKLKCMIVINHIQLKSFLKIM
jgi:hypothetical protein